PTPPSSNLPGRSSTINAGVKVGITFLKSKGIVGSCQLLSSTQGESDFRVVKVDLEKDLLIFLQVDSFLCFFYLYASFFNGISTDEFSPSRGVKQGNPISLFLALLFFGEDNKTQMDIINNCLEVFCSSSKQKVLGVKSFIDVIHQAFALLHTKKKVYLDLAFPVKYSKLFSRIKLN
ncbi:hypothetical protein CR513_03549, partial [Mucuna pruriens]